ncbi:XRE family transcriptional regulator [Lacticaseibacillus brantae]|uniref:Phage-related Cro CI family transcription regulator n=1 Tax=Lacticaseibacillus brantae DSM 23927 TaxID=1423727 RepID=A0A0R2BBM1_9LACO|nr:XRE family transcriptional regulator [Lacticaseibacillus brantae]KRM73043.1 phage-related Cro CI family transcription regulator [Lacticaseibacillus brantae DSM 23927]
MFSNNLKYLRKSRGLDQAQLADALNKSASTISEWETNKYTPKIGILADIAGFFDVKLDDLMNEDLSQAKMFTAPKATIEDNLKDELHVSTYPYIPAEIAAGILTSVDPFTHEDIETIELSDIMLGRYAGRKDIVIMNINGESMNRVIPNHSLIAVQKVTDPADLKDGDIVVFADNGEYSVKRFYDDNKASVYTFSPDSTDERFRPMVYRHEDSDGLSIFGKVVVYTVVL